MPASTPIVGLPYPLGTDPVRDGNDDIQALAQAVDLDLGLVKIVPTSVTGTGITVDSRGNVSLSAVSSAVYINGIFSSTWQNYRIVARGSTSSASTLLNFRLSVGGVANGTNYVTSDVYNTHAAGPTRLYSTLTDLILVGGDQTFAFTMDVFQPSAAVRTIASAIYSGWSAASSQQGTRQVQHNVATAYDGLYLLPSTGTITATIRVYAYGQ